MGYRLAHCCVRDVLPMRIAILVGRLQIGGAELAMIELARELAARGYQVTLYTLFDHADAAAVLAHAAPRPTGANATALSVDTRTQGTFDYHPLTGPKSDSLIGVAWQLMSATWRLHGLLRTPEVQVLYSALNIANMLAWFAVRGLNVRLIWSFHGTDSRRSWEDATAMRACALLSRQVPVAIAVSEAVRQYFLQAGVRPQQFVVIANGTDTTRLCPDSTARAEQRAAWGVGDDTVLVGVVARVAAVKAPERLIAAMRVACERAPQLQAVWVGAGQPAYVDAVKAHARAAGLEQKLRFLGPSQQVPRALNALDVFALLSHSEGAPKSLAEAMATALPCVIDRRAGAETLGDAGWVLDGDDAQAVAEVLVQLAMHGEQRSAAGQRARARIEATLTLAHTVSATEALLSAAAAADSVRRAADKA